MFFYEFGTLDGIIFLGILVFFFIHVKRKEREEKYKAEHPIWDTPEWHEKWRKKVEEQVEEERKRLIPSMILINEEQFNVLSEISTKVAKLVNRFCYEEGFIRYIHKKDNRTSILYNGEDMYGHYMEEPLNDILWVFDQIGCLCKNPNATISEMLECCRINFETIEGHCLLIISKSMQHVYYEDPYSYFDYQRTVGDPESLFYKYRYIENLTFSSFVKYNPYFKQKNYKICELIGNYNEDYKQLYQDLMFRFAKVVAEIVGAKIPDENEWLAKNLKTNSNVSSLEKDIDTYTAPLFKSSNTSHWDESDDYDDETDSSDDEYNESTFNETAEITYSFISSDAPEDKFEMVFSEKDADKLKKADLLGEMLDSDYISENHKSIHRKIIRAIREDLEEKSSDPLDGMTEKRHAFGSYWEKDHDSHQDLFISFDESMVEYEVYIY